MFGFSGQVMLSPHKKFYHEHLEFQNINISLKVGAADGNFVMRVI